ncbi:MAG: 5-(carboxyamino)imidazole ribonucleotide mutase [Eubacteriales bacterium]|jgi:5-(carboxyamino)imidazole ribonucleotide mutase
MAQVGIVMGSDSDMAVMSKAASQLEALGISFEMHIISAHREPHELISWVESAEDRGLKVIIAGAGMAAALPGMCAALTTLPVIGVPLSSKNLDGTDALYSIVQMPSGIPVATVAIDGTKNAAFLAARILALSDEKVKDSVKKALEDGREGVIAKDEKLQKTGYRNYNK